MSLVLVGLGVNPPKSIPLEGLRACDNSEIVFLESFTTSLSCTPGDIERAIGKRVHLIDRSGVEEGYLMERAVRERVVLLVGGDPLAATTHYELLHEARKRGIEARVVHSSSILTVVGEAGLDLYKYGRVVTLPRPVEGFFPESPYHQALENKRAGLHTLVLLDIGMNPREGVEYLLEMEKKTSGGLLSPDSLVVACSRLGTASQEIVAGAPEELSRHDFGEPPHCLVIPGRTSDKESEYLEWWKRRQNN